ncbi:SpoIIE family protein phosphatase [Streptomyces ardesiacus]|uniref:SpoIIE family protein phosphatase n=1 Tax=Streptomyces ardesiacus TaxID=285564 RepID=UPI0036EAE158
MGAIPTQRETAFRAGAAPARTVEASAGGSGGCFEECARARMTLLGSSLAPGAARAMVRAALADWTALGLPGTDRLTEHLATDALVVVSELVTNAVVHAGTDVEVGLQVEDTGTLVVEVADQHPSRAPRGGDLETPHEPAEYGRGLRLVAALAEAWGVTYRPGTKTVWARLPGGPGGAGAAEACAETYTEACGAAGQAEEPDAKPDAWPAVEGPGDRSGARNGGEARRRRRGRGGSVPLGGRGDSVGCGDPDGGEGSVDRGGSVDDGGSVDRGRSVDDGVSVDRGRSVDRADSDGRRVLGGTGGMGGIGGTGGTGGPDGTDGPDTPTPDPDRGEEARGRRRGRGTAAVPGDRGGADDSRGAAGRGDSGGREAAGGRGSPGGRRAPGAPKRTTGAPQRATGTPRRDPGAPRRAPGAPAPEQCATVPEQCATVPTRAGGPGPGAGGPVGAGGPGDGPVRSSQWPGLRDGPAGTGRCGVRDREWLGRGALSFLAEASDLLAGQLDEDLVASLTGQLVVPRLADWCGVWLEDETLGRGAWSDDPGASVGARLARVWHAGEGHLDVLRAALEKEPPRPRDPWRSGPVGHPWPAEALGTSGTALAYPLVAGGRPLGTLVIGRADPVATADATDTGDHVGPPGFPDEITGLVEDLSRRVALAIGAARQYARQATISAVLQRGLLPGAVAEIPGVRSALVYEPREKGGPSGDFYDLFPAGDGRWCFALGDVQGKGPEAAVVIGLARPWLRLLAREQYGVPDVLDRLNQLLLDDATEAADAAARALVAAGGPPVAPGDGPQTRFLSLLYGELVPFDGGVRCTLASAGHPLPLLLGPDGTVTAVARPQTLLGVVEDATYVSETFELRSGDTLLCVTDGVTERRSGSRQFDDGDGLAAALAGCSGLDAELVAERIRRLVHEFGPRPPEDDLALLVLQAE